MSTEHETEVAGHYGVEDLEKVLFEAFEASGTDRTDIDIAALARVDGFHVRGRASTLELIERVGPVVENAKVLDVGSGIGGTARVLAQAWGASVTGIDLTKEYVQAATALSHHVGLQDQTRFVVGSATQLPFEDATFDIGWTEHVQMNIADKARFYGELARVVKPGGIIAFHDIFSVDGDEPNYPTPWASRASLSHLGRVAEIRRLLEEELGLELLQWEDGTAAGIEWVEGMRAARARGEAPAVGLHLLMGATTAIKIGNMYDAFAAGRICVIQAVLRR